MRWIVIIFMLFGGELMAQSAMNDYFYLYQPKTGKQESFHLDRNLLICLKEGVNIPRNFPKSLTQDGKIYALKITGQRGDVLLFNDNLALKYSDIDYIIPKNRKDALRILTGSMVMLTTMVAIITNETAGVAVAVFGLPISIYCFANARQEMMYTKDWQLEIQHSPELLYPGKENKAYKLWPDLTERYLK